MLDRRVLKPGYLTRNEAAQFVNMLPGSLAQTEYRGNGPRCTREAGRTYYRRQDLIAWLVLKSQDDEGAA